MTEHGGNLRFAAEQYGEKQQFLDFSANINPFGVPELLKARLKKAIECELTQYPDPDCVRLRQAFAKEHGLSEAFILCGNGASELLKLSIEYVVDKVKSSDSAQRKARVLVIEPSFGEYSANVALCGAEAVKYYTHESDGFVLDINCLQQEWGAETLGEINAVLLGNPNNPTSTLINARTLASFVSFCETKGCTVIVDEAFIELTIGGEKNSLLQHLKELPNLIIVRAVTKSLAIPGLRLGYALAQPAILACMKEKQITWSVNAFAQCVGEVLPFLTDYKRQMAQWLGIELSWMHQSMQKIRGLTVFRPHTNFMLCKLNQNSKIKSGFTLYDVLAKQGILIRKSSFAGLDERFFRVAIRSRRDNEQLIRTLDSIL